MSAIRYRFRGGLTYGGYSGKARRNRDRSRAARMEAQQMLEEYAEPAGETSSHERIIPIGRRSEFLPSVGAIGAEVGYDASDAQMDLPLRSTRPARDDSGTDGKDHAIRLCPGRNGDSAQKSFDTESLNLLPRAQRNLWRDLPVAKLASAARSAMAKGHRAAGLLFGCAVGSAAAAAVLLIIRVAVL